ncbi:MAG: AAA family ATPase [Alphaproteobacteria bacterium]|nr:AAA family ATPase [Alphaproteobacteria bacterium]
MAGEYLSGPDMDSRVVALGDTAQIKDHLARVLSSPPFIRAPRMQRFLAFLVEEMLAGRDSQLKEYTIAVNVFEKATDFEPGTSAVVRVEAGRLRRLLTQYRTEYGKDDRIVLEVPKGSYVPIFQIVDASAMANAFETTAVPEQPELRPINTPAADHLTWLPTDERRLVTVISCAFGDEQNVAVYSIESDFLSSFDELHARCSAIAKHHGGAVDGGASDRLIVYFGWPNALEDAAGRALTAALEMISELPGSCDGTALGLRIGVATSEVVTRAGQGPDTGSLRPNVVGEAPAIATKILVKTPLNGILIAESTRRLSGTFFDLVPAGTLHDDGREPLLLWRLLKARPVMTRFQAAHAGSQSSIIGRQEEVALVLSRWRLALQSEGQGVALIGDAGIGKSKLAESVLDRMKDEGAQVRVQCSSHHPNSTLYPFVELVKDQISIESEEETAADSLLDAYLARFDLSNSLNKALLCAMLSRSGDEALSTLSASQQKDLTLNLFKHILCAQAQARPTILLIEDIHWADPTTIEVLEDLLRLAASIPLMVLLTSRDDLPVCLARQTNVTSMRLARLPAADCNELINQVLGSTAISANTRFQILQKAEGIPLFLEELTKLFLASDESQLSEARVPESLSDLLVSQLDRLGSTRKVAQLAAVIGRQFTRSLLILASEHPEADVDTALDQLLAAGVIVLQGGETSNSFSFRHALLRDAAYGSMLDYSRRDLHYKVGNLLIDSFPETASEHPELVAKHMLDAGRPDEAIPFWVDAGRKAASRYALAEAITDFDLALDALKALPPSQSNRERELEVLIDLGSVTRNARGYGDQELLAIYQRAKSLAAEPGKEHFLANAVYGLWTHAAGRGDWPSAVTLANEFANLSARIADDDLLEVEACRLLGASAAFRGKFSEARTHFKRALALYDINRHGPRFGFDPGAASAAYLSWTVWHLGHFDEAKAFAVQALTIAEAKNDPSTLAMVLSWLIFYSTCCDDLEAILTYNDQLQTVCTERECRYWQPFGTASVEWVSFRRDGHIIHLDRLVDFIRQFRERYLISCLLLLGAEICCQLKKTEQGLELAASALQFIEEHDERVWEAEYNRLTAKLLLQCPKPDVAGAQRLLLRAINVAQTQEAPVFEQRARESLDLLSNSPGG